VRTWLILTQERFGRFPVFSSMLKGNWGRNGRNTEGRDRLGVRQSPSAKHDRSRDSARTDRGQRRVILKSDREKYGLSKSDRKNFG
jgi:hypothetical protein